MIQEKCSPHSMLGAHEAQQLRLSVIRAGVLGNMSPAFPLLWLLLKEGNDRLGVAQSGAYLPAPLPLGYSPGKPPQPSLVPWCWGSTLNLHTVCSLPPYILPTSYIPVLPSWFSPIILGAPPSQFPPIILGPPPSCFCPTCLW